MSKLSESEFDASEHSEEVKEPQKKKTKKVYLRKVCSTNYTSQLNSTSFRKNRQYWQSKHHQS